VILRARGDQYQEGSTLGRGQARTATEGRCYVHAGFYVQVRYPRARRWLTVAVSHARSEAARTAADAYRDLEDGSGETPRQVRVVSASQLRREGGQREVSLADADVVRRGAQSRKPSS
jgi:hypothetical protein